MSDSLGIWHCGLDNFFFKYVCPSVVGHQNSILIKSGHTFVVVVVVVVVENELLK
jgi:hypothetical protein